MTDSKRMTVTIKLRCPLLNLNSFYLKKVNSNSLGLTKNFQNIAGAYFFRNLYTIIMAIFLLLMFYILVEDKQKICFILKKLI